MDIFFEKGKYRYFASLTAFAACLMMVIYPDTAMLSAKKSIFIWAEDIFPALLPFFICSGFISRTGITDKMPKGIFVFIMSAFSGYPVGAKLIGDMRRRNDISISEAKHMIAYCSISGPAFMLASLGAGMLGSVRSGAIISLSHYIGAILTGIFVYICSLIKHIRRKERHNKWDITRQAAVTEYKGIRKIHMACEDREEESIMEIFTDSIINSLRSLGLILAYMVLFMFLSDMIDQSGSLRLPDGSFIQPLIKGMMEMSIGCFSLENSPFTLRIKMIICSFIVSFGGFSVIGQSMSMLCGSGIKFSYFLLCKIIHALAAALTAFIITGI